MGPGPKGREELGENARDDFAPPVLQWGPALKAGRNRRAIASGYYMHHASMGPGPKGREEPTPTTSAWSDAPTASMGPGPKGREERSMPSPPTRWPACFNGARP